MLVNRLKLTATITLGSVLALTTLAQGDQGFTNPGNIDHTNVTQNVSGDIHVEGKIDGGSNVTLVSTSGSITIDGKIDGRSDVTLNAAGDIRIGVVGGDGDKKIDGGSRVSAVSGGTVTLGDKIDGGFNVIDAAGATEVAFRAKNGIDIGNKIDGGVLVMLCTDAGKIHVHDKIDNGDTRVFFWPPGSLVVDGGIQRGNVVADQKKACSGLT